MPDYSVMLVEDAGIVARDIDQTVSQAGFDVPWKFSSAEEALDWIKKETPDLILMDIQLSGEMDGIEATHEITENWDIPVVFLTAYSNKETIDQVRETGAIAYLIKPLEKEDLLSIIEWLKNEQTGEKPSLERGDFLE
ncbi:MAG: response regulator [bacterium]